MSVSYKSLQWSHSKISVLLSQRNYILHTALKDQLDKRFFITVVDLTPKISLFLFFS